MAESHGAIEKRLVTAIAEIETKHSDQISDAVFGEHGGRTQSPSVKDRL